MKGARKARNRTLIASSIATFLLGFFTASVAQPIVFKGPRKAKEAPAIETIRPTGIQDEATYVYNPKGKPDPFSSFIARQEAFEKKRKRRKPRTYLETLELSQLELIAIIIGPKGNWAMVRDSKGIGHVIKKGTAIGTNGGIVYKVLPDKVIIREKHMDFRGREITKEIVKKLHASK
ncbi:MAG: hypothetical protein DRG71_06450 [Deltaproteobacteria bacterium]|nr:MAG: hypothetical protein DRG71_06450 [Deltaproteobacteria bacterium]